jgi:hypothetical protein
VTKEPRIFKRVGDLRFHAKKKHPQEVQEAPKGLFTTRTAFYFALEPHKYIKDHKPECYDDVISVYARDLVTKWSTGRTPGVTKWLEGWQLAKGPANSSVKRPSTSLELIDVIMSPREIKAHFALGEAYVMAKVDLGISEDYRGMESLTRRSRSLKPSFTIPSGSWKILHRQETKTEAAALLGIQERYVSIILHKPKPHFTSKMPKTVAAEQESPITTSLEVPPIEPANPESAKDDVIGGILKECGILPPLSPIPSPPPIHLDVAEDDQSTESGDEFPEDPLQKLKGPSKLSITDGTPCPTPPVTECASPVVSEPSYVEPPPAESQTASYEPVMLHDDHTTDASYIPTPIISSENVRTRAINLLRDGCMPLLPPARRDWNIIPDQSVQLTEDLKWPPANWNALSPDQKSMSVEFAAMTISHISNPSECLSKDRFTLVHEFNFLVLPGSGPYKTDIKSKARIYNYQAVLNIATGKDRSTISQQVEFLNCFNTTGYNRQDQLLKKLSNVPLKLK